MATPDSGLIVTVLTSTFLGAIVTALVNWRIHASNYRRDYFQKLLEKRLKAYENVDLITQDLAQLIERDGKVFHAVLAINKKLYFEFNERIRIAILSSFWLSEALSQQLSKLHVCLYENYDSKGVSDQEDLRLMHAEKLLSDLRNFREKITEIAYRDLTTLHNVGDFIKSKRRKKKSRRARVIGVGQALILES